MLSRLGRCEGEDTMMKQSNRCVVLGDQTLRGPPRTGVGVRCGQKGPSGGGQNCQDGPAGPCQSHNCLQSILGYRNKLSLGTEVQTLYSFVNLLPPLYKNKQTLKLTVALGGSGSPLGQVLSKFGETEERQGQKAGGKGGYHVHSHCDHRQLSTHGWPHCAPQVLLHSTSLVL